MTNIQSLCEQVLQGRLISRQKAAALYGQPLEELCAAADRIRWHFCGNRFDLCAIINAKSGQCPENCSFCAQSAHYRTGAEEYPLLSAQAIAEQAERHDEQGVLRYSMVTSGRRLTEQELDVVCRAADRIRKTTRMAVRVSVGLLDGEQYRRLKDAGVTRVHNNLETSRRFFPSICTTHTFDDKVSAIRAAQDAGLTVCSGGIMGLGETPEDRIDMALTLRGLGIKSVPVNMLNPIPGTPLEQNARLGAAGMRRIAAVYRFILPDADIRLAGGRGLLPDKGKSCFVSGANAAISGDMLTTAGITVETDMKMLRELGYEVRHCNE